MNQIYIKNLFFLFDRTSLGQRVATTSNHEASTGRLGNLQMTFSTAPKAKHLKQRDKDLKKHRDERQKVIRPIKSLGLKKYVPKQ